MIRFLRYFVFAIQISSILSAAQIDKVMVSGLGGQHDQDVKNAFLIGYSSYNGESFSGDLILYTSNLQSSFDYAVTNNYDLIVRSTTGLSTGIALAPSYPSVKLVMPSGSNSYVQTFSGDVISSPVVITGAGIDSNQTGYKVEFYSIDPITSSNLSSFSNGYIAGQLAFIANTLNCSFDSARAIARAKGSEEGNCDYHNGFGEIIMTNIMTNPLPVELTSFITQIIGNEIQLNWQTATEVNNYGFEIQKASLNPSEGGTSGAFTWGDWEAVGFVKGAGNSNSPKEYSFIDQNKAAGTYKYRLKQIDNDGNYEYSKAVEVDFEVPAKIELSQNYPNPFNPSTTINFKLPSSENVSLKIFNIVGEEVATLINGNLEDGEYSFNFKADNLPSGMYVYQLKTNQNTLTKKMLYLK